MEDLFKGWEYINVLLSTLKEQSNNCLIAPRYIFRGITQRHFTSSDYIYNELKDDPILLHSLWVEFFSKKKNTDSIDSTKLRVITPTRKIQEKVYKKSCIEIEKQYRGLSVSNPKKYIDDVIVSDEFMRVKPEYIRSSAAVRMNGMERRTQTDYIYYLRDMISEMKRRYPNYRDKNDLDLLAEIQHRGGASCLVDFSTNFLVALWFATQDYANKNKHMGFMFCYDTNADLFINDTLTVIDSSSTESIDQLLVKTQKSIKYNGRDRYQYLLWKPSNINDRINRQDSIFIFGIEKFKIAEHPILTLPIPHNWKGPIQQTLKSLFGISSETIYADVAGFATSNTKLDSCKITTYYFNETILGQNSYKSMDLFQRAMSCLIKKDYKLALKYLYEFETGDYENITERKNLDITSEQELFYVEILYSKALCFRHLQKKSETIHYYKKAYKKCIEFVHKYGYYELDNNICYRDIEKDNKLNALYGTNKLYKIIDGYMNVLYDNSLYSDAYEVIQELRDDKAIILNNETRFLLNTAILEIELLLSLNKLSEKSKTVISGKENEISRFYPFCNVLNALFSFIWDLANSPIHKGTTEFKSLHDSLEKIIEEAKGYCIKIKTNTNSLFTYWDLVTLKLHIEKSAKFQELDIEMKNEVLDSITCVIECQRFINGSKRVEKY